MTLKIKKGDKAVVISGKDRGKQGTVLEVNPKTSRIVVDGIALTKRHKRPRKSGQKGQVVTLPAFIDVSNVLPYCKSCDKGRRIGKKRICKTCGKEI
jgi:large subunit ribosomal protein L24